jgi:phosphoribosylformylglycinamidine synthase
MGFKSVTNVRQGKYIEIDLNENNFETAKTKADEMCKKLLSNMVIEDYKIFNK